jgi:hypothetical protein
MEDVGIHILYPFGQFSGLFYTLYIFTRFGTFLPILVCCTKKNLAALCCSFRELGVDELKKNWVCKKMDTFHLPM